MQLQDHSQCTMINYLLSSYAGFCFIFQDLKKYNHVEGDYQCTKWYCLRIVRMIYCEVKHLHTSLFSVKWNTFQNQRFFNDRKLDLIRLIEHLSFLFDLRDPLTASCFSTGEMSQREIDSTPLLWLKLKELCSSCVDVVSYVELWLHWVYIPEAFFRVMFGVITLWSPSPAREVTRTTSLLLAAFLLISYNWTTVGGCVP